MRHVQGHTDTNKPPTAGVQLVGHTSIMELRTRFKHWPYGKDMMDDDGRLLTMQR